ncbi:23S rRNA (uracil(1939)-C(5))-methyltransferase RlmD [Thermomicrobium sp. 4228-Ro]|uniref:23S rRNA (uracil(1939)-C(5))-methyltransferase RlmD n=1 Tax=Thermomicrobium sp. 4228-Ro TaxID=2993937 RepID=UPI0022492841|nr:23S rRNA (uracil(1939)-C(5))-methyltransferase RlmD [Thermomicrobium sp. 4228-Ro]MCX2727179.1 23S rRNA (uracil(1939)-C(5))-methyltransferase RlmD [Thermomicrobium sp. 4228-Ro]
MAGTMPEPRTVRTIELHLEDMAHHGAAIGREDGRVVFAEYGIPGEDVVVAIERDRKDHSLGRVVDVRTPSPERVDPPCPYFGVCGGCQWQHIRYEHQLLLKQHVVRQQLRRIGKFDDPPVSPTIPSPDQFGYRNHARFSVDGKGNLGYISRPGHGYRFIRIDRCLIMHPKINEVLGRLQGKAFVKHQLMVRYGINTGELLVHPDVSAIDPEIPSGQRFYHEALLGHRFRISASSFFQTNTGVAERLVQLVLERIAPTGREVVVDAYAGVGTFAAFLAPHVARVIGIEEAPSAVDDARVNLDQFDNVEYVLAKVEQVLAKLAVRPDVVILDPPRVGCAPEAIAGVLLLRPPRIVYVSCDPATLARDLRKLVDGGYRLLDVTPLDMFPQTYHIESVATLELAVE